MVRVHIRVLASASSSERSVQWDPMRAQMSSALICAPIELAEKRQIEFVIAFALQLVTLAAKPAGDTLLSGRQLLLHASLLGLRARTAMRRSRSLSASIPDHRRRARLLSCVCVCVCGGGYCSPDRMVAIYASLQTIPFPKPI